MSTVAFYLYVHRTVECYCTYVSTSEFGVRVYKSGVNELSFFFLCCKLKKSHQRGLATMKKNTGFRLPAPVPVFFFLLPRAQILVYYRLRGRKLVIFFLAVFPFSTFFFLAVFLLWYYSWGSTSIFDQYFCHFRQLHDGEQINRK